MLVKHRSPMRYGDRSKRHMDTGNESARILVRCRALRASLLAVAVLTCAALLPDAASAHGISGRASLPVPPWLFAWAAAIVLVVSFVMLSTLWSSPRLQDGDGKGRRLFAMPPLLTPLCGLVGLGLFALVIYAGYEGVASYTSNFDPTFIYVIFWVGIPVA